MVAEDFDVPRSLQRRPMSHTAQPSVMAGQIMVTQYEPFGGSNLSQIPRGTFDRARDAGGEYVKTTSSRRRTRNVKDGWVSVTGFRRDRWSEVKLHLDAAIGPVDNWVLSDGNVHAIKFRSMACAQECLRYSGCRTAGHILTFEPCQKKPIIVSNEEAARCHVGTTAGFKSDTGSSIPEPFVFRRDPKQLPWFQGYAGCTDREGGRWWRWIWSWSWIDSLSLL